MQENETDSDESTDSQPEATTATTPRSETRYPLAFDANGNPLALPPQAVAWRVRRGGGKRGRPRNVFDAGTGRQLEIALGASIEDLAETNVPADRYLLYPVDAQGAIIPGVVAVTEVTEGDDDDSDESGPRGALSSQSKDPILAVLAGLQETIKSQHEVIKNASEHLSRALGSAVSGYAPVRAVQPAPAPPIVMEQPAPLPPTENGGGGGILAGLMNMKPEQMFQIAAFAQQMFSMIKGAASAASVANVAGAAVGAGP